MKPSLDHQTAEPQFDKDAQAACEALEEVRRIAKQGTVPMDVLRESLKGIPGASRSVSETQKKENHERLGADINR